jgi:hypothetical protein
MKQEFSWARFALSYKSVGKADRYQTSKNKTLIITILYNYVIPVRLATSAEFCIHR